MQFISFMIYQFYNVLTSNRFTHPNFTDLFRICESILHKEKEQDKKIQEYINNMNDLYKNCFGLNISIPQLELIFYNNAQRGFNYEIDIGEESYTLGVLFYRVNEVIRTLTSYVAYVAYTYDVDVPFSRQGGTKDLTI